MRSKIFRLPDVAGCTGLGRSTVYQKVADKTFPPPIPLGARAVGWLESEVSAWLDARIAGKGDAEVRSIVEKLVSARKGDAEVRSIVEKLVSARKADSEGAQS